MKNLPILVAFLLSSIVLSAQSFNEELKVQLDSIMTLDQAGRIMLMEGQTMTNERKAELLKTINKTEEEFFGNPWGQWTGFHGKAGSSVGGAYRSQISQVDHPISIT